MGRLTTPGDVIDLRPLFTRLYRTWVEQGQGASLTDLADALRVQGARYTRKTLDRLLDRGVPVSSYATRQPPMWLLLWLCEQTRTVIEIGPDGIRARAATSTTEDAG